MLDPLTGLLNRRTFDHWMTTTPGKVRPTALLLIDVDSFKLVNDLHGHAVGDQALRRIARVVADHVRTGDTALRLGGDEFAVILSAPGKSAGRSASAEDALLRVAGERAQAISEAVSGIDWHQMSRNLRISVSIGIAAASLGPRWPDAADLLYRQADANLYEAKFRRASRNRDDEGGLAS
jgi:diguanylate cyclase (GGDEF)-like protein